LSKSGIDGKATSMQVTSQKNTATTNTTICAFDLFCHRVKHKLHDLMQSDRDFTDEDFDKVFVKCSCHERLIKDQ